MLQLGSKSSLTGKIKEMQYCERIHVDCLHNFFFLNIPCPSVAALTETGCSHRDGEGTGSRGERKRDGDNCPPYSHTQSSVFPPEHTSLFHSRQDTNQFHESSLQGDVWYLIVKIFFTSNPSNPTYLSVAPFSFSPSAAKRFRHSLRKSATLELLPLSSLTTHERDDGN